MGFRNNAHSLVLCTFQDTVQRGCRPDLNFTVLLSQCNLVAQKECTQSRCSNNDHFSISSRIQSNLQPSGTRAETDPRPGRQCSPALIVLDVLLFESLSTSSIRCLPESSLLCFPFPSGYLPSSLSLHTPLPYYFALCHSSINIFYNIYMSLFAVNRLYTHHTFRG